VHKNGSAGGESRKEGPCEDEKRIEGKNEVIESWKGEVPGGQWTVLEVPPGGLVFKKWENEEKS